MSKVRKYPKAVGPLLLIPVAVGSLLAGIATIQAPLHVPAQAERTLVQAMAVVENFAAQMKAKVLEDEARHDEARLN